MTIYTEKSILRKPPNPNTGYIMFFHRIQNRLIFLFIILVIAILAVAGFTLDWAIRQSLEAELGRKLVAVAGAASVQLKEEQIGFLLEGAGTRMMIFLREQLVQLQSTTGVKQISVFDFQGRSLLDSKKNVNRGEKYFRLKFYPHALEKLQAGESSYSVLFTGIDGAPTMSAYYPVFYMDHVVAGVCVDGSATFLDAVRQFRKRLYTIGILGTLVAIGFGLFMAGTITRPIRKLMDASQKIGMGDYEAFIPGVGRSELGLLAERIEDMRNNILEREKELKAMLAGVAHEIRNPLGGIELYTGLLSDEVKTSAKAISHVQRINQEVQYLKSIVTRFLEYAKPQNAHKVCCSIYQVILETKELFSDLIKEKQIRVDWSESIKELYILVDPYHFKQILINLMKNAIESLHTGGWISIKANIQDGWIQLLIEDNGSGIPEDIRDKVFQPIFSTRKQGTGLGLPIVKGLAEANGGNIVLVRSVKSGTEFAVTFRQCNATVKYKD